MALQDLEVLKMQKVLSLPKAIPLGARIQLKNGVLNDVKVREWEFSGVEKGKLILQRREGFTLVAKLEDIDWESPRSAKIED